MCLTNLFQKKPVDPLPQPVPRRELSYDEIWAKLHELFPTAQIFLSDSTKQACDITDIEHFLEQDNTNRQKYVTESYDCDDFAYRLMGQLSVPGWAVLAKAIVWTDVHALNGCLDTNLDWWFIEPQSGDIKPDLAGWQGKIVNLVMM